MTESKETTNTGGDSAVPDPEPEATGPSTPRGGKKPKPKKAASAAPAARSAKAKLVTLKAPDGCTSVGVEDGEESLDVDEDGLVRVPADIASELVRNHGFTTHKE